MAPNGAHSPSYSAGQQDIAPSKWSLLQVIEDIREPLGLKGTSISLLRAMISFIKGDHISAAQDDGHICFASNVALAKRTHVSVQTVERHITKLVTLGLLSRRSSANGKRWARRDTSGRIVLATGLSLMPLSTRFSEFIQINQTHKERVANLSILRDKCAIALASLKRYLPARPDLEAFFNTARNLLRRRATEEALTTLLKDITSEIQEVTPDQTDNLRDTHPKNEGHKEPHLNQSVKEEDSFRTEVGPDQMERAYPRLCAELRTAHNQADCERRMSDIANNLDLGDLWFDIKKLGPAKTFMALGYILERIESIEKPRGYAFHLLQGLTNGSIAWETLLKIQKRKAVPIGVIRY
ncbi:replication protein C [Sulfitobacter sp. CB-A]|nr:replication protein C [Sulfitobacter sp. CB-A]ULO22230.1 helix-turn-helix domain-containing protein [Sulfitobacter sp. CB2047]